MAKQGMALVRVTLLSATCCILSVQNAVSASGKDLGDALAMLQAGASVRGAGALPAAATEPPEGSLLAWIRSEMSSSGYSATGDSNQTVTAAQVFPYTTIEFQKHQLEEGTKVHFFVDEGCQENAKTNRVACLIPPGANSNHAHLDFILKRPLDGECTSHYRIRAKMGRKKREFNLECASCNMPCPIHLMLGVEIDVPTYKCPIADWWHWNLPLSVNEAFGILPPRSSLIFEEWITRPDNSTAIWFTTSVEK
mmetsp:Transcript_16956/g.49656  ORF Transcript_16956/g.49656 Transcript_16956/m.49656 type:complete len:252 (+) Transcript_16956:33-788(+)|eukprot:CAMPEP_0168412024 /NCGR_PEP_ID=MMETSP0228-20121227/28499_1 /TAXON_ID=133427 /ORGANISM="Protoceratium reticulatum, Strain CCCM 535 (=CCMP 1889)" /LENGTH=251 /DNA_ID=CAMNT_0008425781 /DNA_START=28 /DNA_END=783 /DNA_ORIENTATION=+